MRERERLLLKTWIDCLIQKLLSVFLFSFHLQETNLNSLPESWLETNLSGRFSDAIKTRKPIDLSRFVKICNKVSCRRINWPHTKQTYCWIDFHCLCVCILVSILCKLLSRHKDIVENCLRLFEMPSLRGLVQSR